ncbi:MAG: metallophosphoesterase family protein [Christensenellales bacterium]
MKNIVIMSDTHNRLRPTADFFEILQECDYIFHLGDGSSDVEMLRRAFGDKVYAVKGNCDYSDLPLQLIIQVEQVRFLLTHGHSYRVKTDLTDLSTECSISGIDVGLYGHTHRAEISVNGNVTLINPGSLGYDRTYCYLTVIDKKVLSRIVQL